MGGGSGSPTGDRGAATLPWRAAMARALYDPDAGFFASGRTAPADHFRTSVHASPLFAGAVARLLVRVDAALGHPAPLDLVDVGAGRGELLRQVAAIIEARGSGTGNGTEAGSGTGNGTEAGSGTGNGTEAGSGSGTVPADLAARLRLTCVELAPRPDAVPEAIRWQRLPPERVTGMLIATELLDNVPFDVVEVDADGRPRLVLVDRTGVESLDGPPPAAAEAWLRRWWPLAGAPPGARAEVGDDRDAAWAALVSRLDRGLAVAVDYGHTADRRPALGTLTGYRQGRRVRPAPDGTTDITAHVAVDAIAAAAATETGVTPVLLRQRGVLRALGVRGERPPLAMASADPTGYVRALAAASQAAELIDADGLGGHFWLFAPTVEAAEVPADLAAAGH